MRFFHKDEQFSTCYQYDLKNLTAVTIINIQLSMTSDEKMLYFFVTSRSVDLSILLNENIALANKNQSINFKNLIRFPGHLIQICSVLVSSFRISNSERAMDTIASKTNINSSR